MDTTQVKETLFLMSLLLNIIVLKKYYGEKIPDKMRVKYKKRKGTVYVTSIPTVVQFIYLLCSLHIKPVNKQKKEYIHSFNRILICE